MKKLKGKGVFKRGISIVLAASLAFGLAACGKAEGEDAGGRNADGGKSGGKSTAQGSLESKQNVFKFNELELGQGSISSDVAGAAYIEEKIYLIMYDDQGDSQSYKIISLDKDGSNKTETDIELPDEPGYQNYGVDGEVMSYGSASSQAPASVEGAAESEANKEEGSEDAGTLDGAADKILPGEGEDLDFEWRPENYESTYYYGFQFLGDDRILATENKSKGGYSEDGGYSEENDMELCLWDLDGKLVNQISLNDFTGENGWLNGIYNAGNGKVLLLVADETGQTTRILLTSEGNVESSENVSDNVWTNVSEIVTKSDGSGSYLFYYSNDNWRQMVAEYDSVTNTVGEGVALPDALSNYGYNDVVVSGDGELIFSGQGALYRYHFGDTELTEYMNCVNSDIASYGINNLVVMDEDHFVGFYYEYMAEKNVGGLFTRVAPEDVPDKKTLVLGMNWANMNVTGRVVEFNKKSDEYRIVVTDYSKYNTEEDYSAGITKLNSDIVSGNMPDIIVVTTEMPVSSYISKGLFADVDKLMAQDEEISKNEYLQNVFDAYRVDGKLYYILSGFSVGTYAGKKSILGDRTTWNMDEFLNVVNSLPQDMSIFGAMYDRNQFIYDMMRFCGSDFVDASTGKCNFDSDNFIKLLEFAATIPESVDGDIYEDKGYWENYESQYREDRTLLMSMYLSYPQGITSNINGYFGEDVSFVGFPTDSGTGSVINFAEEMYALSAKSANLDGAWQFVRYYLTDEYQETIESQIPVSKKYFEKWLKSCMEKPYWIDENGVKQEYDNTFWMNGESIVLPELTQAQVDELEKFILSIDKPSYYNENVINIVTEEAAAFFEGQKSAKDVADIIQSRVKIYVNE